MSTLAKKLVFPIAKKMALSFLGEEHVSDKMETLLKKKTRAQAGMPRVERVGMSQERFAKHLSR
jgi:hypothetical protein